MNAVIDRVNTTGAVWLGSTLACAQCHTHKFDPLPHVEYYRMLAFFDQTEDGGVSTGPSVQVTDEGSAPLLAEFESERARLEAKLDAAERAAASGWVRWTPTLAIASEGPELRVAADASIMSVAHNPQTSVYDLEGPAPTSDISAVRLEALPDLSLPSHGPGRAKDGSFVLTRIRLFVREAGTDAPFEERAFRSADGPDGGAWAVRSRQVSATSRCSILPSRFQARSSISTWSSCRITVRITCSDVSGSALPTLRRPSSTFRQFRRRGARSSRTKSFVPTCRARW